MTTDKSIEEIAQEYISYMKILEQAGSFAVFLSDRFGHYYYVTEYVTEDIQASDELNIEKLVHPDDLEVVRRIDKKVWEFLDTLPEEEKLAYKYIYELRVLDRRKYVRMIYQTRLLAFKDDNFLAMGMIDLAPDQSANSSVRFQIKTALPMKWYLSLSKVLPMSYSLLAKERYSPLLKKECSAKKSPKN